VIWQFIVLRNNEHEVDRARAMAEELGIRFFAKTFAVTDPELVPADARYRRRMNLKPCQDIYRAIFVYWNGDVVVCCYDQNGENVIGNLLRQTLTEVWNGRTARHLRRRIARAVSDPDAEPGMCRSCLKWSHHSWSASDGKTSWLQGDARDDDEVL
jgi:radical SAM protein with 4Fe4S-binding SPASM domain